MSPVAGFTRFRQWAFSAAQSAVGTAATPSGALPWRGSPVINPNWTEIDGIDTGSIDPIQNSYRTETDTTVTLTGPLDYDSLSLIESAGIRTTTPTGAGPYTWTTQALSLSPTTLSTFTAQWGDDYGTDDARFFDGVLEKIQFSFDESLGPWQVSMDWYFGSVNTNVTRVANLNLPSNLPLVFGADTALYIDDAYGNIGNTQISSALHSARITITNTIDKKRFANGSNSRFAVSGFGLAGRTIEAEFTFAKVDAIEGNAGEIRKFLNATGVTRYLSVVATSTQIAGGSTAYSWTQNLGLQWNARSHGELGGNSTITLTGRGRYDSGLGYAYKSIAVNANATLP